MKELKEHFQNGLSKGEAQQFEQLVAQNEEIFEQLMQLFLEGPTRSSQHAAGLISSCVARKPCLLHPYLPAMLNQLEEPAVKDASKRNTLRILQFIPIPEAYEGKLMAFCFEYLAAPKEAVAIKVFSMTILHQLCQKYPDLQNELKLLIEHQLPFASPAFLSRAGKILKALEKKERHLPSCS